MAIKGITPVLNVSDVPRSLAWFESLGWKRGFTWNDGGIIEGAGVREFHLRHPGGHMFRVSAGLEG